MRLGIIITTYNRSEYLKECFDSLLRADIPEGTLICLVDDASTEHETIRLFNRFYIPGTSTHKYRKEENKGIKDSLRYGYDYCFKRGCDVVMNLDGDAVVRNDFIQQMSIVYKTYPERVVSGFHCTTKNNDGTERHEIVGRCAATGALAKKSVGGINMLCNVYTYAQFIQPALAKEGNWDHNACIEMAKNHRWVLTVPESVIQHIGIVSSMGHSGGAEAPDTADDFIPLVLEDVTLICVDDKMSNAVVAIENSVKDIKFGAVKILSNSVIDTKVPGLETVEIPKIGSKEAYSEFIIKELYKYVNTKYALIVQHDGYVKNYKAWSPEFLKYDYIGAPWWFDDKYNVGNGGFSLRSREFLLKVARLAEEGKIKVLHPEDSVLCRDNRWMLEKEGMRYAPYEVAERFSFEAYGKPDKRYKGSFGFHGTDIIWNNDQPKAPVTESKTPILISQFFGLGDILFCMSLVNKWRKEGHEIVWPVVPQYLDIQKHFPWIKFVPLDSVGINHTIRHDREENGYLVRALRWSVELLDLPYHMCMKAKYMAHQEDWKEWRKLNWVRHQIVESKLFEELGLLPGEPYTVVNHQWGTGGQNIYNFLSPGNKWSPEGLKLIEMKMLPGYTLLDWAKVLENATFIHTVSTSIIYMLEVLDCKAEKIHIYARPNENNNHANYRYILTDKYNYEFHG